MTRPRLLASAVLERGRGRPTKRLPARWIVGTAGGVALTPAALVATTPSVGAAPSCTGTTTVTCTFAFTGSTDSFTVPAGVTQITVDAFGAPGGPSPHA